MSERWMRACLVFLLAAGLLAGISIQQLNAQVLYGSVVGTVTDQTGAVVPNAKVTITNKQTGFTREVTTDDGGRYSIPNVPEGVYDVTASGTGFKPLTRTNVAVNINTVSRVDAQLEVGAVTEQVTVEASAAVLQTEKSDVHTELGTKVVQNLPLPLYRNYQSLIDLVPGATPSAFQNAVTDTPARALTTNVNGTARNNNNTRLDGATNVYIWLPHHTVYVAPAETIETVNISTNNFDAEQGMAGGAAITVATKSGTNDLHGSLFVYHDNQHLKSRNFFFRDARLPKSIRNIDGFTLGGPVRKNKLFFFGGWEGNRERVGKSGLFTVPTAPLKSGDFSGVSTIIFNPFTGNPDGTGRQPFANNKIPNQMLDPITQKLVALIPPTNQPKEFSNFFNSATQSLTRDNFDVKVNWNRTEQHMIWGKYSRMQALVLGKFSLGSAGGSCLCDGGNGRGDTLVQLGTLGHTWTFGPRFLVDGTLGFTRMGQNVKGPDFGKNIGSEVLGIPGTNGPDPRESGFPIFNISGYDSLGNVDGWSPIFRNDQSWTFTQNANWSKGAHELRFGYDLAYHHLNHWQPELGSGPRGSFDFGGSVTACKESGCASDDQFNGFATFLLGLPTGYGKSSQFIKMTGMEWQHGLYFRDRWRVTQKLTLNLGLRWEYYPLMTRAGYGGIEVYDPGTNLVSIGGLGGNPRNVGVTTSKKMFAPRFGIAYQATRKTVIRTGYGITYDPMPLARPLRGFYPLTVASDFSADPFKYLGTLNQGIPSICCPDISSGKISLPTAALMRSPYRGLLHRGYIQSWNLIIERELPASFVGSVGYVGTQTVHQFADLDINNSPPGTGNAGRPLFQTFKRATETDLWDGWLSANYHSLQTTINRQFRGGLLVKGAYTYSKAISWTNDDGWAGLSWNWGPVLRRNRAAAGYDRTHIFQMAYVYDLPVGKGKKFASSGAAGYILGNWQMNGIFSAYTGTPFTVSASGSRLNSRHNAQTADQVGAVKKLGAIFDTPFFDPSAFLPVTDTARFGTSGRNVVRGPGVVNWNASIFRSFQLTERFKLEFRTEAFNASNTPHFNNPSSNASNRGTFMKVRGAAADERQFRFGLRLAF